MSWKRILRAGVMVLLIVSIAVAAAGAGAVDDQSDDVPFDVVIVDTNEPVAEGETLEVTVEVTNTGNASDSQQIHLKNAESEILDSAASPPVTLEPGASERVTLTWDLEKGDAGTHDLRVSSNYGADTLTVDVEESVFFDVEITETNAPITAGDRLNVTAEVTNPENVTGTEDVWLELDGSVADRHTLALEPGETDQIELALDSTNSDAGDRTLAAVTNGDRDATAISIDDPSTSSSSSSTIPTNVMKRDSGQFGGTDSTTVPGSDVERITFDDQTASGYVFVEQLRDAPADVDPIDDHVGLYRIDVPDAATEYAATVEFTLAGDSFDDADTESVSVLLWTGEEWAELDTETTVDDEVTVTAETDGFSLFAVTTGSETVDSVNETDEETESVSETDEANETSTDSDTDTSASDAETDSSDTEPTTESSDEDAPGFGIGVSLLALLLTALLGRRRLRNE